MATTRIMPLHVGKGRTESRAISDIIDYVANPQKTDNGRLIAGFACDSRTVDAEFLLAKRQQYEVYDFLLKNWHKLKFSPPIQTEVAIERKINPKRMQREIQSQLQDKGIGTKAQQALKLQHEQCKLERKTKSREQKEAEKDRQFAIRQEKKKAKHRGR